jgi:two-component system, OmpR family, sensor histidine kinase BaeS
MFHSLRNRLIFSHILPALLIIPLMGAAMVYILETRLLLPMIYDNLAREASLMAEMTRTQPIFWQNKIAARALANGVSPYLNGKVSLLTLDGQLLASSDETATETQQVDLPDLTGLRQGEVLPLQNGPQAEAFTPVYDLNGHRIGVIRMTTKLVSVSDQVYQLRYLMGFVLVLGVLAGIALGSYLAFSINRSIQSVTRSIQALAQGSWQAHVEEQSTNEMRVLAKAVNTLVDQLDNSEKSRRQLLANLVHELGRPLGAIRSAIQALLHGADKDPQLSSDLLTGMDDETIRLQHLLDDLAGLHDQILGRMELNQTAVPLNDWLSSTLSPWEADAGQKGLGWVTEIPSNLPIVFMDPDRMAQALGNILSNAIKFTPHGGDVSIVARYAADRFSVQITDSGPGIPLEERDRIFQPFYRGSQGKRIVEGMGLGLSIARDIVAAHAGDIKVSDSPVSGTSFTLEIPAEVVPEI